MHVFSEVKSYVHLRPVSLLSAARSGRDLNFFWNIFFLLFSSQQSSNYLKYHVFSRCDSFVRHFENEMPLTINHGGEMSTISGNGRRAVSCGNQLGF